MNTSGQFEIRLFGAFQLIAPDGSFVPLGRKAQALVAILASELGAPVTRSRLQDLLWSLSGPKHGRDSLKKALQAIRKAVSCHTDQLIVSVGDQVWLNESLVHIERMHFNGFSTKRTFLEGLDLREPEFENWLREMRNLSTQDDSKEIEKDLRSTMNLSAVKSVRVRIAVKRPVAVGDRMAVLTGDVFLSRLIDLLSQSGLVEVVDLREGDTQFLGGGDLFLFSRAVSAGTELQIQLSLRSSLDNALVWSRSNSLEASTLAGAALHESVCHFIDEIHVAAKQFSQSLGNEKFHVTRLAMDGIENLFRLAPENLEKAASSFSRAIDICPSGSLYAWYAFLTPFRFEQRKGVDLESLREQAEEVLTRSLELDPYNPVSRSLLAHVFSFLFRDFDKANSVLAPIRNQPPDTPIYYFSESMLNLYTGNHEVAHQFALIAERNGRAHPYSYAFSTSLCMIDALEQRTDTAIDHGKRALAVMPSTGQKYEPTLRYLTAAYASAGKIEEARSTWQELQMLNPGNSLEQMRDTRFPIASEHMRASLDRSLGAISQVLN